MAEYGMHTTIYLFLCSPNFIQLWGTHRVCIPCVKYSERIPLDIINLQTLVFIYSTALHTPGTAKNKPQLHTAAKT